jgi:hypothetical protein
LIGAPSTHTYLLVLSDTISIASITCATTCLLTKREKRPQQRSHQGEVLASKSAGIAIFRFSIKDCAIWCNFNQNPMQFDQLEVSTYLSGGPVLTVPSKLHIGWGSSPHSARLICGLTASINPLLAFSLEYRFAESRLLVIYNDKLRAHMISGTSGFYSEIFIGFKPQSPRTPTFFQKIQISQTSTFLICFLETMFTLWGSGS